MTANEQALIGAIREIVKNWERGDLAHAVNVAEDMADDIETAEEFRQRVAVSQAEAIPGAVRPAKRGPGRWD